MTVVFISWSGEKSKKLAEALRAWIPSTLQFAQPYFTPNDVEKGSKWSSEIIGKLSEANVGIVCLTRENFQRPWILFEAGALSKDIEKSKICSILFGMDNSDLSGPLTTFQSTLFEKGDFKKLVYSINQTGGDRKLDDSTFERVFEMWWPELEERVNRIIEAEPQDDQKEIRSDREILEEVLELSRLAARRSRAPARRISEQALSDLFEVASALPREAKHYKDSDILAVCKKLVKVGRYLERQLTAEPDTEKYDELDQDLLEIERFIQAKSSDDIEDEIPF